MVTRRLPAPRVTPAGAPPRWQRSLARRSEVSPARRDHPRFARAAARLALHGSGGDNLNRLVHHERRRYSVASDSWQGGSLRVLLGTGSEDRVREFPRSLRELRGRRGGGGETTYMQGNEAASGFSRILQPHAEASMVRKGCAVRVRQRVLGSRQYLQTEWSCCLSQHRGEPPYSVASTIELAAPPAKCLQMGCRPVGGAPP